MAEHYTQGRQGQGARRRRNNHHRRQRMPRAEKAPTPKPSLVQRILSFFGFNKKKEQPDTTPPKGTNKQPKKSRTAVANSQGGNPGAQRQRRRPASTLPTRNARLYVGNLSYEATEAELEDLFKGFGNVRSVEIIYNSRTYKSKGYAFVEMHHLDDARRAAEVLHGQPFMGRELMVSAASERIEPADDASGSPHTEPPTRERNSSPTEPPAAPAQPSPSAEQQQLPVTPAGQTPASPAEAPAEAPTEAPAQAPDTPPAEHPGETH